MLAGTQPVEGYIDFDEADYFCIDCLNQDNNTCPTENEETDSPAHCSSCGRPLLCQLTTDGVEYVKNLLQEQSGCCRELWPVLFADYLD